MWTLFFRPATVRFSVQQIYQCRQFSEPTLALDDYSLASKKYDHLTVEQNFDRQVLLYTKHSYIPPRILFSAIFRYPTVMWLAVISG